MSSDAANQVRENIRAYLQHVAEVEVGTVLTPASRAIVGFCAEWVKNRLDEKWLDEKVVPFAGAVEPKAEPVPLTESALVGVLSAASRARKEAAETIEAIRGDLEEERKYRDRSEGTLEAVRGLVKLWESYAEDLKDSHTSMQRIQAVLGAGATEGASPDPLHPTGRCRCGGEGRCDWCKANPDPYQSEEPDADDPLAAWKELYWHCAACGNHELAQPTDEHGDSKTCVLCGKGPARVMTLKEAAALEQAVALGRPDAGGE